MFQKMWEGRHKQKIEQDAETFRKCKKTLSNEGNLEGLELPCQSCLCHQEYQTYMLKHYFTYSKTNNF